MLFALFLLTVICLSLFFFYVIITILIIIVITSIHVSFFLHQYKLAVFHWSLSDNKSPQVSTALFSILANLNNAVVGIIWIFSLIYNSSSLFF